MSKFISKELDAGFLSVLIHFYDFSKIVSLDETLFSLALQNHVNIEPVIIVRNSPEDGLRKIKLLIQSQPWRKKPSPKVVCAASSGGPHKKSELNLHGIEAASGRYVTFLDCDSLVGPDTYSKLITALKAGPYALVVDSSRRVVIDRAAAGRQAVFVPH